MKRGPSLFPRVWALALPPFSALKNHFTEKVGTCCWPYFSDEK